MHARNERSTLFSCARITICSIRSRQSLKLFDARGLSISLLRPRSIHAALSTALRVLIMNIVFYDPAFSFVSRFFFPFLSFFFSLDYDFLLVTDTIESYERVFSDAWFLMTDVDRFRANSSANFSMFEGLSKGFFIFYFATRGLEEDEVQS